MELGKMGMTWLADLVDRAAAFVATTKHVTNSSKTVFNKNLI